MKKSIYICAIIVSLFAIMTACEIEKYVIQTSYIAGFFDVDSIKLMERSSQSITISIKHKNLYSIFTNDENTIALCKEQCKKYNDTHYNKKIDEKETTFITLLNSISTSQYKNIEISSNQDFDANHPKGSSLGDIVTFVSVSPNKYLNSGYQDIYHWDDNNLPPYFKKDEAAYRIGGREELHPVIAPLDQIDYEKNTILGIGYGIVGVLIFNEQPTTKGVHELTVTLTLENGKSFSETIEITFE